MTNNQEDLPEVPALRHVMKWSGLVGIGLFIAILLILQLIFEWIPYFRYKIQDYYISFGFHWLYTRGYSWKPIIIQLDWLIVIYLICQIIPTLGGLLIRNSAQYERDQILKRRRITDRRR